jgi:hypothetical protein
MFVGDIAEESFILKGGHRQGGNDRVAACRIASPSDHRSQFAVEEIVFRDLV